MSDKCKEINCLSEKTNNIQNYLNKGNIKVKKLIPDGRHSTIGDENHRFSEVWTKDLHVNNSSIHFSNGVDLKTTDEGLLVTTSTGVKIIGTSVQTLSGDREVKTITKPGIVLVEATNSVYNVEDTGTVGDKLKFIRTKNNEGWEALSSTVPSGTVYTMFRDGPTGSLYIGGNWNNELGAQNTQNLAKLPYGSTGPWEPVGSSVPYGTVYTMFKDELSNYLYIGGDWISELGVPNTANLAKLHLGSSGPWEPVGSTVPNGTVYTMFKDDPTGSLYIGGSWYDINNADNTRNLAKLPYGSTGPWKAVGSSVPNVSVRTMFKDEISNYLYIGGSWSNQLGNVANTQHLAKLHLGSTGSWKAVGSTAPTGNVLTIFRDGPTGSLYIGGEWTNKLGNVPNTKKIAKLPFGSTGSWEAVGSSVPSGSVRTMFKDEISNYLYIGGYWKDNINGAPNTQNLAKLPFGSTGSWEPVSSTAPSGSVRTMFRDKLSNSLYIGGGWTNVIGSIPNTEKIARVVEETNIIVNGEKSNIPNIGDTLEFVYANPWVKLNYSS